MSSTDDCLRKLKRESAIALADAEKWIRCIIGNKDLRTDNSDHHFFFYEVLPAFNVATYLEACSIIFSGHSSLKHDATLYFNDGTTCCFECTRAVDGKQLALQREHLVKYHHAPAFQEIEAKGTMHNRSMPEQNAEFREILSREWSEELTNLFVAAIENKNKKKKYEGFTLIVTFDDYELPDNDVKEKSKFLEPISRCWEQVRSKLIFKRVFIVGDSQLFLWDSWEPEAIHMTQPVTAS